MDEGHTEGVFGTTDRAIWLCCIMLHSEVGNVDKLRVFVTDFDLLEARLLHELMQNSVCLHLQIVQKCTSQSRESVFMVYRCRWKEVNIDSVLCVTAISHTMALSLSVSWYRS